MKSALLAYGLLASASTVTAHIQMSNPYPIRSPLDPNGDESKKDYSYTNPLDSDGSDYPCKGYANDPFRSVASYSPGGTYELDLQGSATHDGGSCQISLSYDTGKSFQVIHSMLGGCPLTESYKFTIPSDAPTGDALLTWTWFNKVGNREMYMNCAQVTIGDGSKKRDLEEMRKRDAFSSLPPIFIANVNGPGQCTTIENYDVNFPLPGPSVEGSINGTDAGFTCTGDAPFLHASGSSSGSSSSSSSGSGASSVKAAPVSTSKPTVSRPTVSTSKVAAHVASTPAASSSAKVVASSFGTEAARVATVATAAAHSNNDSTVAGAAADDESARYVPGKPCVDGAIICGPGGTSWSMCSNGRPVHMGSVAAGMYCSHGAMQRLR
ncbi:CAZyme family AA11 [Aspergillus niger]|nr:CAZyme family AA11 [Aspergillus niger]